MEGWSSGRRKTRLVHEERLNRDGRWVRQFNARMEVWPIFEHWAAEADFRLTAVRGQRRLYLHNADSLFYHRWLDIKVEGESRMVTIISWIEVRWPARLLSGWQWPAEMPPSPRGVAGLRLRRRLCHDLNSLLERFRQAPILHSSGFHPLDLDNSALALAAASGACAAAFLLPLARQIEVRPGLANPLLAVLGWQALAIAGAAIPLVGLQAFLARKFSFGLWRWLSSAACFVTFLVVSIVTFTRTVSEMDQLSFAHHCLSRYSEKECRVAIGRMPVKEREIYLSRLRAVEKELSFSYPR